MWEQAACVLRSSLSSPRTPLAQGVSSEKPRAGEETPAGSTRPSARRGSSSNASAPLSHGRKPRVLRYARPRHTSGAAAAGRRPRVRAGTPGQQGQPGRGGGQDPLRVTPAPFTPLGPH